MKQFFGKYRGTVVNNVDPKGMGRIQVSVPLVLGQGRMSWAMPCVPYAGSGVGFYAIPPKEANVWVEFEGGNLDCPIWSGCFWNQDQIPVAVSDPKVAIGVKILKTDIGSISLDEANGGSITIETTTGDKKKIVMDQNGIEITYGDRSIKLDGKKVSINGNALEVT